MSNIHGLFFVDASHLGAAHEEMIALHGSVEVFIREGLGWSDAALGRLRDGLLE
jgi:hypothetical protein